jgi:hypothetical protein
MSSIVDSNSRKILPSRYTKVKAMEESMDKLAQKYARRGHPNVEELIDAQGLIFPRDPRDLFGSFWPEEESIDDFLSALREWRGHAKTDPAA